MTLKPGWNAVFLHVDAAHDTLDNLVNVPGNPIAEIWQWQPPLTTVQFTDNPLNSSLPSSTWAQWKRTVVGVDTLVRLSGNAAYLVNNTNSVDFIWTVTGKPVPPRYEWSNQGLNLLGFSTPAVNPPNFDVFTTPAPELKSTMEVYRYQGGATPSPALLPSLIFPSVAVTRGQAFWVRASTNFYNRYFGPVEVTLQNSAGVHFSDSLGTYRVRLKNLTASARTVTMNLLASGTPPAGQPAIAGNTPLLVRGALNTTNLSYSHTVLNTQHSFTLAAGGLDGSTIEVVLGLNRTAMTAPAGSGYAGILRLADTEGLSQIDLPVTATVADSSGLWIGDASVTQVGHYLKTYAQANSANELAAMVASNNLPAEVRDPNWTPRENSRAWRAVASSADGTKLVAVVNGGQIYTSGDSGVTWTARDSNRAWSAVASSADGSKLVAAVNGGQIYTSTDSGVTWTAREASRAWSGVASSADGVKLVAVNFDVLVGTVYRSTDSGVTWTPITSSAVLNSNDRWWTGIASSADGTTLVAVNNGYNPGNFIYVSADAGATWQARMTDAPRRWVSVAMSDSGERMVAVDYGHLNGGAEGGRIYTSTDRGTNWTARGATNDWSSVASSATGDRLVAVAGSIFFPSVASTGRIYTSADGGATWVAREATRAWASVAASADGARLVAVNNGSPILTSTGTFPVYQLDTNSSRIVALAASGAPYVATATNTSLGSVSRPFPLRLIIHNNSPSNAVNLLQRVFVGQRFSTNVVVATKESVLDVGTIGSARRMTATHLPFALANAPWPKTSGAFAQGSTLVFNVLTDHNDHASNPFLHTFHPDHDNLKADLRTVQVQGAESYTVARQMQLTFTAQGNDFAGLTAATRTFGGTYRETLSFRGLNGQSRDFTLTGTFVLYRVTPIATLTTN